METKTKQLPNDEQTISSMNQSSDLSNIDSKIMAEKRTKNGEKVILLRSKIKSTQILNTIFSHRIVYHISNESGVIIGKALLTVNLTNDNVIVDYTIRPEFRGKGIGKVMLEEIVKEIFKERVLDNLTFNNGQKTAIDKISLQINDDNYASIKIAKHNGFKKANSYYQLTKDEFMAKMENSDEATLSHN